MPEVDFRQSERQMADTLNIEKMLDNDTDTLNIDKNVCPDKD